MHEPPCAVAEFRRFAGRHPIGPEGFLPRARFRYEVVLASVLDVTDVEVLAHLELDLSQLVDDDRTITQQVGKVAYHIGYQAVLSPSATGVDAVLAVFMDNIGTGRLQPRIAEQWATLADL